MTATLCSLIASRWFESGGCRRRMTPTTGNHNLSQVQRNKVFLSQTQKENSENIKCCIKHKYTFLVTFLILSQFICIFVRFCGRRCVSVFWCFVSQWNVFTLLTSLTFSRSCQSLHTWRFRFKCFQNAPAFTCVVSFWHRDRKAEACHWSHYKQTNLSLLYVQYQWNASNVSSRSRGRFYVKFKLSHVTLIRCGVTNRGLYDPDCLWFLISSPLPAIFKSAFKGCFSFSCSLNPTPKVSLQWMGSIKYVRRSQRDTSEGSQRCKY